MSESEDTRGKPPEDMQRMAPAPVFAVGDPIPNLSSWVLERKLGGGGFGEVWLARHAFRREEKPRAVKFCTDPAARHRLVTHERNVVLRVMKYAGDHPNIVPLLDCNLDGDIPWLMYEFVEGGTLASLIEQWRALPLPKRLGKAVRTLHAIAGALAKFHQFDPPLVHRDLKPANILMTGSVPRLTDFGIGSVVVLPKTDPATAAHTAYAARLPTGLSYSRSYMYAPPERDFGSAPHPHDDVYALGIIAYQMVMADLTAVPGPAAMLNLRELKVPDELVSLIINSVAHEPNRRPKDASEWETALARIIEKARKKSEPAGTASVEAEIVPLPQTTAAPAKRSGPPPIPAPPAEDLTPDPRLVDEPVALSAPVNPTISWVLLFMVLCGLLALIVILLIEIYLGLQGK